MTKEKIDVVDKLQSSRFSGAAISRAAALMPPSWLAEHLCSTTILC